LGGAIFRPRGSELCRTEKFSEGGKGKKQRKSCDDALLEKRNGEDDGGFSLVSSEEAVWKRVVTRKDRDG